MAKLNFTHKAVQDLSGIWKYTCRNWSEKQADNYYNSLIENCVKISKNPNLGKNYFEVHSQLFGYNVHKHIIFYRVISNNQVEITRILHERMNLKNKLKNDPLP